MKKSSLLKIFWAVIVCAALGLAPEIASAQRGGHGGGSGGGGFHGGSASYHGGGGGGARYAYSGSRYYGSGYHGGGYYGGHGYYGWRGGYWGYPRYGYGYGYGWGIGIGFGWGGYWPGYAYPYGYSTWWGAPYYYPYYAPYGYPYAGNGNDDPPANATDPNAPGPNSRSNLPANPSRVTSPQNYPGVNSATRYVAATRPAAPNSSTGGSHGPSNDYQLERASIRTYPPSREEVQNAIRALRDMPPAAFQRRIDSGRYNNFTAADRELVNRASPFPLSWDKQPRNLAASSN